MDKTFLCVIPARGGSKGLPNKNIKPMAGKPMIYWTIKAAKESGIFDRIIVSSDSDKVGKIAVKYGVEFSKRPHELASDTSPVRKAMSWTLNSLNEKYDYVQLIQPTTPLLEARHIRNAAELLLEKDADMVISVAEAGTWKGIAKPLPPSLCLKGWFPSEARGINRQQIKTLYALNGYIYLAKWDIWEQEKDYWETNIHAYVMDKKEAVDVDDMNDFVIAEALLKHSIKKLIHWPTVCRVIKRLIYG